MRCERCKKTRPTTNSRPDGQYVWRLPEEHQAEQMKVRSQLPNEIAKAQKKITGMKKRREEVIGNYDGLQNANQMKPPPDFSGFGSD